ncbi:MAG: hypothetical protein ACXVEF_20100 [Polyangiales bacterium]
MRSLVVAAIAALSAACAGDAKPKPPLEVVVKVTSDPGRPLENATLVFAGSTVATTGKTGSAQLTLTGNEGDTYEVSVKCPAGFQSPTKPLLIPMQRLADPSQSPEYEVTCPPTTRTIVVAVRAENGPSLNVLHLGRVVGRTDAAGAATVLMKDLDADTQFELTLDTSEKGNEQLRPQNPTSVFTVKRSDDVLTFDVKFVIEEKKKVWKAGPKKTGPIALPTKINP